MKTNIREKLFTLLFMAGGLIILLSITGFSSGVSIIRHDYFIVTASDTIPEFEQEEMEAAKVEVLEEIDWDKIKSEMIQARIHMDSIMENFDFDFDLDIDIDLDDLKVDMEEAMKEMENIDWEKIRKELELSRAELEKIDLEQIQMNIEKALEGIDIEEIRREIERSFEEIELEMKDQS